MKIKDIALFTTVVFGTLCHIQFQKNITVTMLPYFLFFVGIYMVIRAIEEIKSK